MEIRSDTMSSVLALDLETKNMSYDIGGFGNTHMFQVSTVSTWDGNTATVYVENPIIDSISKSGYVTKSLRDLKYDLDSNSIFLAMETFGQIGVLTPK